ncbi:hypothetical protein JCM6882_003261 [Rhodosporidiobolus microsporus]
MEGEGGAVQSDNDSLSSARSSVADFAETSAAHRTVLFPADDNRTFKSSSAFFKCCRTRLYNQYGMRTQAYRDFATYAVARCARRMHHNCRFSVRAEKVDGRWRVVREKCVWEHSHDAEEKDAEEEEEEEEIGGGPTAEEVEKLKEGRRSMSSVSLVPVAPVASTSAAVPPNSPGWSASTRSSAMQDLVKDREAVFVAQRALQDDARQARSEKLATDSFAHLSASNLIPKYSLRSYKQFCEDAHVPPFPITSPLLALCLFAKCSTKDIYYHTFVNDMKRLATATRSAWENVEGFVELDVRAGAEKALKEFLAERKSKRVKRKRTRSKPTVVPSQNEASSEADSSSETDPSSDDKPTPRKRKRPASSTSPKSSSGSSDSSSSSDSDGSSKDRTRRSGQPVQLTPSPLPPLNAAFSSFKALYLAYVKALVPSLGIGCQIIHQEASSGMIKCNRSHPGRYDSPCPWILNVQRDSMNGTWRLDAAQSNLKHNHGPAERLLRDPSWIPTVRNADARKALGLSALPGAKESRSASSNERSKRKTTPVAASPSASTPNQRVPLSLPAVAPSSSPLSPADLSAFLASIHPSLSALAPTFPAAGVDTLDALVSLSLMEAEPLRSFLDLASTRCGGGSGISALQAKLLLKGLRAGGGRGV